MEDVRLRDIIDRAVGPEWSDKVHEAILGAPSVSVRINPSKISDPEAFVSRHFGEGCSRIPWSPWGFMLPARPSFTLDPLFHCGCYYVQDSSAMAAGHVFRDLLDRFADLDRPIRVLDLCAAPGGKSTDMAASLRMRFGDRFVLVSNEVMKGRASMLAANMAAWGDPNVVVTSVDPGAFSRLEGFFDIVVADVPCSGEGMFRKDAGAVEDWSPDAVVLCARRQRRILADVWPSLRKDGCLLYSTCTFEKSENDDNVGWAASELGAEVLPSPLKGMEGVLQTDSGALLVPGLVKGEGQFAAALAKTSGDSAMACSRKLSSRSSNPVERIKGDLKICVPGPVAAEIEILDQLKPLQCGTAQGTVKGRDFIPSADLALGISFERGSYPEVELDLQTALKFLHRDAINPSAMGGAPKGFVLVTYDGHPLGFVKNLGNRCNNLYPQSRRIRMDI